MTTQLRGSALIERQPASETTQVASDTAVGLTSRVIARFRAHRYDLQLAADVTPEAGSALAAHAARLHSRKQRDHVASWVQNLLAASLSPRQSVLLEPVQANHPPVAEALVAFHRIMARLNDTRPVSARGMARLRLLLRDGTGPCYRGGRGNLTEELHTIIAAL